MNGTLGQVGNQMVCAAYTASSVIISTPNPDLLSQIVQTILEIAAMPPTSFALLIRNADNTQGVQELPLTAGTFQITVDATGVASLTTAPAVTPATPIRTNDLTLDATAAVGAVKTITFASAMPDTNYVVIPQMNGLAGGIAIVAGSQTTTTYQVKVTALIVGTITLVAIKKS